MIMRRKSSLSVQYYAKTGHRLMAPFQFLLPQLPGRETKPGGASFFLDFLATRNQVILIRMQAEKRA